MKATLEFNLPEDIQEFKQVNAALDMALFIWDFQGYLREQNKYADKPDNIEAIYEKWFEILSDHNINLDKLMT